MVLTSLFLAFFTAGLLMGVVWGRGQRQKLLKLCQDSLALCEQQEQWIKQTSNQTAKEIALTALAFSSTQAPTRPWRELN